MKRLVHITLSFAVCCSVIAGVFQSGHAAEKIPSARRLPSRAYGYLSIRDAQELKQKFSASLFGQLLNQPELADVKENIYTVLKENAGEFEERTGITLEELLSIPQGELAVALIKPPGKALAPVAFVDYGDKGDIVEKLFGNLGEYLQDQGAERSTEEFAESEIVIYKEGEAESGGINLAYCRKDQTLVVGYGVDTVKAVLTRWDGEHDNTLLSNDVFSYLVKKCNGEGSSDSAQITWYLDPLGLVQAGLSANARTAPQLQMVVGMFPVLGLDKLKAIGGTVEFANSEFDTLSRFLVYIEQPTSGLMNVFKFPAGAQSPPSWVSNSASSFSSVNWDIEKAYQSVATLINTFQGAGALERLLDESSDRLFSGDLHLKTDFLDLLTGKIVMLSDQPDEEDLEKTRSLFALEVKNAGDAEATLSKIASIDGFPGETRDFRGHTIYELPLGGLAALNPQFGGGGEDAKMGLAVVHDHLMIAMDVTLLEQVIRNDPDAQKLADSDTFKEIAKHFPQKTSVISYNKDEAELKSVYQMLRQGNAEFLFGGALRDIDFSLLPKLETISRFLPPSGSYMIPDERGFFVQSFTAKKAE